jgi:dipeptidyl aminopeptidase/acylaminoacyl peptidase
VNYRGSTGFGMRYLRLGHGGLQGMHNDVDDARRWAIESGVADPKRVAVVGGSWGGYLALGAATGLAEPCLPNNNGNGGGGGSGGRDSPPCKEGGQQQQQASPSSSLSMSSAYAAVVAVVPLVSVGAANSSKAFRGDPLVARYWKEVYGKEVSTSKAAAERLSPVHHVSKLKGAKLLLAHGESDPRVPKEQGDEFAAKAKQAGVQGIHLTYAKEGHSIRREPNVLHLWSQVERFLCRSLALPPPPALPPDAAAGHTASVHWMSPSLAGL